MRAEIIAWTSSAAFFFAGILGFSQTALASMSHDQYLRALRITQKQIEKERGESAARNAGLAGALSAPASVMLLDHPYRVGDNWDVIAFLLENPLNHFPSPESAGKPESGRPAFLHYEVVNADPADAGGVVVKVTQLAEEGVPIVDPKVESVMLGITDQLNESGKGYFLVGKPELVKVPAGGVRSSISVLDLFPLDAPGLSGADRTEPKELPVLPDSLKSIVQKHGGFRPELSKSYWFERNDFFGRAIQFLWQQGDPWPAYMKTPHGISILIRKGNSP